MPVHSDAPGLLAGVGRRRKTTISQQCWVKTWETITA